MRPHTFVFMLVVIAGAASAPRGAVAAPGRVEIPAFERRVDPTPAAAATPEGPTVTLERFLATRRRRIGEISDAQIAQLRRLLALTADDDPLKPDLWHRLGDLCAEKERAAWAEAVAHDGLGHDDDR
jgi:hypothetical protein